MLNISNIEIYNHLQNVEIGRLTTMSTDNHFFLLSKLKAFTVTSRPEVLTIVAVVKNSKKDLYSHQQIGKLPFRLGR